MNSSRTLFTATLAILIVGQPGIRASGADDAAYFEKEIRPILKEFCLNCHSTEKQKGDFDMERFSSLLEVKKHPKAWQGVAEQLANDEMPPKDKPQPPKADRERLTAWVASTLDTIARERAGDPGPVVLRRLSNSEYTYTIRDLTGAESLSPVREFPVDGAAGEGFTNTGQSLVMSPSLVTKYLDAGKEVAAHAVLLPDGLRFSNSTTRRDWSEELLAQIRGFYREFTDPGGGDKVNLQGIVFETNGGGRLPVEKYLAATLAEREALAAGGKAAEKVAQARGLNAKYLGGLFNVLSAREPSILLDGIRTRWRTAKPADAGAIAGEIAQWQKALWKFSSVGHIGKLNGPKAWMEPLNPLIAKQEVKLKIPPSVNGADVTLYLVVSDAGDGNENDFAVWDRPRIVSPGRPDLLLRDVRETGRELARRRERIFSSAAKCLLAAAEVGEAKGAADAAAIARKHGIDAGVLDAWLGYLGLGGGGGVVRIDSHFSTKLANDANYDFIRGWGSSKTPLLVANSSGQNVRIPGNMKAHSVAVHPSEKLQAVVGWRSPVAATLKIEASVTHAHPECGNGVAWSLELRRGATRQRLATGTAQGAKEMKAGPIENVSVQPGDLVSLLIGPRGGNHSCDLTAVDMTLATTGGEARKWNLAEEVSPDVLAGNPHADRFGNDGVWHFYTEPDSGAGEPGPVIPAGSVLAKWQLARSADEKRELADAVQKLLTSGPPAAKDSPDAKLYEQLASLGGPLSFAVKSAPATPAANAGSTGAASGDASFGVDPAMFGRHPNGQAIDAASLCVRAPSVIEIRLPATLAAGCEFVTTGSLDKGAGAEGSVQIQVLTTKPELKAGLLAGAVTEGQAKGVWTSNNQTVVHSAPIVVNDGSQARKRFESAFDDFRKWFPAALCYTKIVPVDEVVTLTLFHREDDQLARLMLDDTQKAKLDRLWDELHYISHDALTLVDAFEQIWQYATQDADPKVFEPMRKPIHDRAAAFRQRLGDTQPAHVDAVLEFAGRAFRRSLADGEKEELRGLYRKLRGQELSHDQAVRLLIARVLVAPAFLYRAEKPGPGVAQVPVGGTELANRLSYFIWASTPDAELRALGESGKLRDPATLAAQTRRMLGDARVRRLATEFACQWLHVRDFDTFDEKSARHFPVFASLRGAMYEESVLFFTDLFQRDGPVLDILGADHTFLNEALAKHYGIPGITGEAWRRVDGVKKFSRGGILFQATTLSKQSGASRTSPILRGNWVAEALLGDKLPRPPKDVPRLPEDEATETLTVRQLTEKHSADPRCSGCHRRIDGFGYALESFDAIGRLREKDLGGRPIDTGARLMDGAELKGSDGLRSYLLTTRRDAFLRQFCRKLLGYSLGRGIQLSDEPLLKEMQERLAKSDFRVGAAIETIVLSRQFREIRGREMVAAD